MEGGGKSPCISREAVLVEPLWSGALARFGEVFGDGPNRDRRSDVAGIMPARAVAHDVERQILAQQDEVFVRVTDQTAIARARSVDHERFFGLSRFGHGRMIA